MQFLVTYASLIDYRFNYIKSKIIPLLNFKWLARECHKKKT